MPPTQINHSPLTVTNWAAIFEPSPPDWRAVKPLSSIALPRMTCLLAHQQTLPPPQYPPSSPTHFGVQRTTRHTYIAEYKRFPLAHLSVCPDRGFSFVDSLPHHPSACLIVQFVNNRRPTPHIFLLPLLLSLFSLSLSLSLSLSFPNTIRMIERELTVQIGQIRHEVLRLGNEGKNVRLSKLDYLNPSSTLSIRIFPRQTFKIVHSNIWNQSLIIFGEFFVEFCEVSSLGLIGDPCSGYCRNRAVIRSRFVRRLRSHLTRSLR